MRRTRKTDRETFQHRVYVYKAWIESTTTPHAWRTESHPGSWPVALQQVSRAQQALWNACQAAWQTNRERYESLMQASCSLDPLREKGARAKEAREAIRTVQKQRRQQARRKKYPGHEQDAADLAAASACLSSARAILQAAEAAHRRHIKPQLTALLEALWTEVHALGQASPLAWYNERVVTDAFRNSVERFLRRLPHAMPPRPKTFLDRVRLTYHFTGPPLSWEQWIAGKSSMTFVGTEDALNPVLTPELWGENGHAVRRARTRTKGVLRISDTESLTFQTTLNRRPPQGALVKGVDLVGREVVRPFADRPGRWHWALHVLAEEPPATARPPLTDRAVALDLNWRLIDEDRVRVGVLFDGDACTPLYFPPQPMALWRRVQETQTRLSRVLEQCKVSLATLWETTPLPPDIDPRGPGWAQTGQGGLLRLKRQVEALPGSLPSRASSFAIVESWVDQTWRLRMRAGKAQRLLHASKAGWQNMVCKQLCDRYSRIAVEALNMKQMAEQVDMPTRLARSQQYRQLTAPGAFLVRLKHTAERLGVQMVTVDPAGTTQTCTRCGAEVAQTGEIVLVCARGHHLDTDENAARVIYQRAFVDGHRAAAD